MAVWALSAVNAMAAGLNTHCTNSATIIFFDATGSQAGPACFGSAIFADAGATGVISCRAFTTTSATASWTLGTARLFNSAGATVGIFSCTSAGAVDFVFGGVNVATGDTLIINSWVITVQTA